MFWIKIVKKIIMILQSEISPSQIAAGAAFGALIGLAPAGSLHSVLLIILVFMLNVNIASAFVFTGIFALLGLLTDPFADKVGYFLLVDIKALVPVWANLYNMPLVPFTRFYNTVVMGNLVFGIVLFAPVFMLVKRFIVFYRANLRDKVAQWKIMKFFKIGSAFNVYDRMNGK
ncbi:MAG: TIGR03546 family protein [Endomicrobiales bacterium]|nr:TIGR03546 family protein [Endomicrobiales bacterium]